MCSNRFCCRSEPVKGLGATRALCRDCWMRRHEALPSVCCWRMRSLTRKPITSTFGNAWERRAAFPRGAGCPQRCHSESDVPSLSEKTVPPTRQDRKPFLGRQTQALRVRPRTQLGHPDPPSPATRPCLQPLSPKHRLAHRGCQQSPSVDAKPLTQTLSPLDATLTKTREGVA